MWLNDGKIRNIKEKVAHGIFVVGLAALRRHTGPLPLTVNCASMAALMDYVTVG